MRFLVVILSVVFLVSCGSSKSKATPEQLQKLNSLVQEKNFEISSDMAYPQATSAMNSLQNSGLIAPGSNANQISLIGNVNYLRIVGDSIYAELPYFGERRMNTGYNGSDSSISIENTLQDYSVVQNQKDQSYIINFQAKTNTELLQFYIIIYPSFKTSMTVNGSTRVPINYTGLVKPLN